MSSNKFFPENEYITPITKKKYFLERISFGTSFFFNIKFLQVIFRNRKLALNNKYDTKQWALSSYQILEVVEKFGGKYHITGFDQVDKVKDEPVVFISNHMGTMETMIFPGLIAPSKEVTFVVKESLLHNKIFGPVMRARNPIAVGRKDSRKDLLTVITEGQKFLAQGTSVIIFPQSTRTEKFIPEEFNSLGIKLAQKANVKVVPMAIKTDFWANGRYVKDWGSLKRKEPIFIKFGEPMEIKGNGKEEHKIIIDFIDSNLKEWNKIRQ